MAIKYRQELGRPLTYAEGDENFRTLEDSIEKTLAEYPTLAAAMADDIPDGVVFLVNDGDDEGYWRRDSSDTKGAVFLRDIVTRDDINSIQSEVDVLGVATARYAFDTLQEAQDMWASFSQEEKDALEGREYVIGDEVYKWTSSQPEESDFVRRLLDADEVEGRIENIEKRTPEIHPQDNDLLHITDNEGAIVATINEEGLFDFLATEKTKQEINVLKKEDIGGLVYAVVDAQGKILFGIDDNGAVIPDTNHLKKEEKGNLLFALVDAQNKIIWGVDAEGNTIPKDEPVIVPEQDDVYDSEKGPLEVSEFNLIQNDLLLPSTAVGRESSEGADDADRIPLTTTGYAHPSVVFIPEGWNGFRYWMAITPTFGIIAEQSNPAAFENPHILCSHDGIDWQEPAGITNPVDLPPSSPSNGYWSDTHLEVGDDGFLHLYYRASHMPAGYVASQAVGRGIIHRKSRDGVTWSERTVLFSDTTEGVDSGSGLLSPAFVKNGSWWHCYDVIRTSTANPIAPQKNQTEAFIFRRRDMLPYGDFGDYDQADIINLKNRPWGEGMDPWHIDACMVKNTWFLLINVGDLGKSTGRHLYLAYSGDGWNFTVLEEPIFADNLAYRSAIVPIYDKDNLFKFRIYYNQKGLGRVHLWELTLNYDNQNNQ